MTSNPTTGFEAQPASSEEDQRVPGGGRASRPQEPPCRAYLRGARPRFSTSRFQPSHLPCGRRSAPASKRNTVVLASRPILSCSPRGVHVERIGAPFQCPKALLRRPKAPRRSQRKGGLECARPFRTGHRRFRFSRCRFQHRSRSRTSNLVRALEACRSYPRTGGRTRTKAASRSDAQLLLAPGRRTSFSTRSLVKTFRFSAWPPGANTEVISSHSLAWRATSARLAPKSRVRDATVADALESNADPGDSSAISAFEQQFTQISSIAGQAGDHFRGNRTDFHQLGRLARPLSVPRCGCELPRQSDFVLPYAPEPLGSGARGAWFHSEPDSSFGTRCLERHRNGRFDPRPAPHRFRSPTVRPFGRSAVASSAPTLAALTRVAPRFRFATPCLPNSRKNTALRFFLPRGSDETEAKGLF